MEGENKDQSAYDDKVNDVYKLGFEHGYWLTKGDSKEYDGILKRNSNNYHYAKGIVSGRVEAIREKTRETFRQMDEDRERDKDRGIDIG